MLGKEVVLHYLKRYVGGAAAIAAFAAALYNSSVDDLRLQRQIDNNYENIMLAPVNDVESSAPVNINTASVHHLQRIDGIGATKAQAIVEYRETHGSFQSISELVNVSGIGEKTLNKILDVITV